MNQISEKKFRIIFDEITAGRSISVAADKACVSKTTVARYKKIILDWATEDILCACGRIAGHRGWCTVRLQNSVARQEFLQNWNRRSNSRPEISRSDLNAFLELCRLRWPATDGQPVCPHCGAQTAYFKPSNRQFVCGELTCRKPFTPTSGTVFSSTNISYQKLVRAIYLYQDAKGDLDSLTLKRELNVEGTTALYLLKGLEEANWNQPRKRWMAYWKTQKKRSWASVV